MFVFGVAVLGLLAYMFYLNFSVRLAPSPTSGSQTSGLGVTFDMDLTRASGCGEVRAKCTDNIIRHSSADSILVPSPDGVTYCVVQQDTEYCDGSSASRFDIYRWGVGGWASVVGASGDSVPSFGGWGTCKYNSISENLICNSIPPGREQWFEDINLLDGTSCECLENPRSKD